MQIEFELEALNINHRITFEDSVEANIQTAILTHIHTRFSNPMSYKYRFESNDPFDFFQLGIIMGAYIHASNNHKKK